MNYKNSSKSAVIRFVAGCLGLGLGVSSPVQADSASASLGTVVSGAQRSCITMHFGAMTNSTCPEAVGWEIPLAIRTSGTKAVEIAIPDSGSRPLCYVYRMARNGTSLFVSRTPVERIESPVRILRFAGLGVNTNFVLNAGCTLERGQTISTVSWDA
jgi:hypothetical protein